MLKVGFELVCIFMVDFESTVFIDFVILVLKRYVENVVDYICCMLLCKRQLACILLSVEIFSIVYSDV